MKRLLFMIITLLIFLVMFPEVSRTQPFSTISQQAFEKNFKSIHQIEWENHRNFIAPKGLPQFQGRPRDLVPRTAAPSREVFGYLPYWVYVSYPNLNYSLLTTIAYFGAEVDGFGNIVNLHDWPAAALINLAHGNGVRVVLTAILFDKAQLRTLLSSATYRTRLINNLLIRVQLANADGVTIDFEGVPGDQRQNLTTFMTELADSFHTNLPGSFVTIFTPAVDWSNAFDYLSLSQVTDGLIMQGYDYHYRNSEIAGPVAPLTGGNIWGLYNVTWTVNDYITNTDQNVSKLILSVPFYGFEWPTQSGEIKSLTTGPGITLFYTTAYANAQQYGRIWDAESQTPWYKYNNGQWHQGWYDDSLSLALKFNLVNNEDLKGIAIWALSYDGQRQELQAAISNAFGATAPPLKPTNFRITNIGNGEVRVEVNSAAGATGYKLYQSFDGVHFDSGTAYPGPQITLSNLSPDSIYYFRMAAVNGNGESNPTEVLAVKPIDNKAQVLIVNGFDRTSGTVNTFDFIRRFAPSVVNAGFTFDACANEAIGDDQISLSDYEIVVWISGEEGTADESFSNKEQSRIATYLENGGNLFISGSEIGYDLVEKGSASDKAFYRDYFKAQYVRDKVATYTLDPTSQGIFSDLGTINFDNGFHGTYNVDYPDGILPTGGAILNMSYQGFPADNNWGGAGIQYAGTFGQGSVPGKLVYLAVGFETLYPQEKRDQVMSRILNFFGTPTAISSREFNPIVAQQIELFQNYPNPFNPSTTIRFIIRNKPAHVRLQIFDVLGRNILTLIDRRLLPGDYKISWNGTDQGGQPVPSGVYIYRLTAGDVVKSRKMSLIR